jgi:hypothetical protein
MLSALILQARGDTRHSDRLKRPERIIGQLEIRNQRAAQRAALLNQALVEGKAYQFGVVRQVELFEETRPVGADGFHTEEHGRSPSFKIQRTSI